MDKKPSVPMNWIARIAVALLILVLLSAHFSGGMLARYRSTASGGDSARVAKFSVTETGEFDVGGFPVVMDPDDDDRNIANIEVQNNSEVSIRCEVKVQSTGNLPLSFYTVSGGEKAAYVDIPVGSSAPVELKLYADWTDEEDSYLYHREIDHVIVTLVCSQID